MLRDFSSGNIVWLYKLQPTESIAVGVSKLTYRTNLQTLLPVYMIGNRLTIRDLKICQYSAHLYGH